VGGDRWGSWVGSIHLSPPSAFSLQGAPALVVGRIRAAGVDGEAVAPMASAGGWTKFEGSALKLHSRLLIPDEEVEEPSIGTISSM